MKERNGRSKVVFVVLVTAKGRLARAAPAPRVGTRTPTRPGGPGPVRGARETDRSVAAPKPQAPHYRHPGACMRIWETRQGKELSYGRA